MLKHVQQAHTIETVIAQDNTDRHAINTGYIIKLQGQKLLGKKILRQKAPGFPISFDDNCEESVIFVCV